MVTQLDQSTSSPVFSEMAGGNDWLMVRDGGWKIVARREAPDAIALLGLAADPLELDNRIAAAPADVLARLESLLASWRQSVGLAANLDEN